MAAYLHALDALGEPTRRRVFELLRDGPLPVGELAAQLPVSRPAVSQHLKILKEARLVTDTAAGARRLYSVDVAGIGALRAYLDEFWSLPLERFKAAAERGEEGGAR